MDKVSRGWLDFDGGRGHARHDVREVGKLGKVLGPRGLMPNPKTGTVTLDVAKAIREIKAGKIEFKVNAEGVLHTRIGKASFDGAKLELNLKAVMEAVVKAKPPTAKGTYVKSAWRSRPRRASGDQARALAVRGGQGRQVRLCIG